MKKLFSGKFSVNNDVKELQGIVEKELATLNDVIHEKEADLESVDDRKNSCHADIEKLMKWLKATVNELPDVQKESMEDSLACTHNILKSVEEKKHWLASISEKCKEIGRELPKTEQILLEGKLCELEAFYEEFERQTEQLLSELQEKKNERKRVSSCLD